MELPSTFQWISFATLAGLVSLDSGPWLLSMLGRPLPAATALGLLWGDPVGGALVGGALEILYAGILPVGASRYPEAGLAGLAGAGVALWGAAQPAAVGLAFLPGLLSGLAAGQAGKHIETWRRRQNAVWVAAARARAATEPSGSALVRVQHRALAFAAALGTFSALVLLALGITLAAPFVDILPEVTALRPPLVLFAAAACGAALRLWGESGVRVALGGGVLAGLLIAWIAGAGRLP